LAKCVSEPPSAAYAEASGLVLNTCREQTASSTADCVVGATLRLAALAAGRNLTVKSRFFSVAYSGDLEPEALGMLLLCTRM